MWQCLSQRLGNTLRGVINAWLPGLLAALAIIGIFALFTQQWQLALVTALGVLGIFLAGLIAMILSDLIICAMQSLGLFSSGPGSGPGSGGGPLTGYVDCQTARQMLADAIPFLSIAQQAYDEQSLRVSAAQNTLNQARTALTVATIAVGAAAFFPWLLPAAIAGAAAAAFAVGQATSSLSNEAAALIQASARLGSAQRDVAAAEATVAQACQTQVTPQTTGLGTTGTATVRLSGLHYSTRK